MEGQERKSVIWAMIALSAGSNLAPAATGLAECNGIEERFHARTRKQVGAAMPPPLFDRYGFAMALVVSTSPV